MTVEDRIERSFDGISQTAVSAPLTSGQALAAVLRHEPDILMIDELRDAAILPAVDVSAHKQVYASLKAPTAASAITCLLELCVAPALLASVLNGVLALRLVRRLYPVTRELFQAGKAERQFLGLKPEEPSPMTYRPGGDGGYRGFTGIHELLTVDDTLRTMIRDGASARALEEHARQSSVSLQDAARAKILRGETSIEEAMRVLGQS
jgi:general secretion pathway protein E